MSTLNSESPNSSSIGVPSKNCCQGGGRGRRRKSWMLPGGKTISDIFLFSSLTVHNNSSKLDDIPIGQNPFWLLNLFLNFMLNILLGCMTLGLPQQIIVLYPQFRLPKSYLRYPHERGEATQNPLTWSIKSIKNTR